MERLSNPRYDQAPENFSESGQRMSRSAHSKSSTGNERQGHRSAKDIEAIDSVTRGGGSTAESLSSVCSVTGISQFVREEDGRSYNILNENYFLPADDLEWTRVDKLHAAFYVSVGGLYPCSQVVRDVLKPEDGVLKEILDLGCGSGLWGIEIAKEYPHTNVLGIDLVPLPLKAEQLPENFEMEVDDINLGLSHFYGRFDLVHMRWVYYGLKDFQKTVQEVQKCLKPGGIAMILAPEPCLLDEGRNTYLPMASDDNPDGSWNQRLAYELQAAGQLNGGDKAGSDAVLDEGFWDNVDIIDPKTCGTGNIYFPIGLWATSPDQDRNNRLKFSGALMRQVLIGGSQACRPLFRKCGVPADTVDEWLTRAEEELRTTKFKCWLRIRMAWGRRRASPGLPAPPLAVPDTYIPLHLQSDADTTGPVSKAFASTARPSENIRSRKADDEELYQVEIYSSKEESLDAVRRRMAFREPIGPSIVTQEG